MNKFLIWKIMPALIIATVVLSACGAPAEPEMTEQLTQTQPDQPVAGLDGTVWVAD